MNKLRNRSSGGVYYVRCGRRMMMIRRLAAGIMILMWRKGHTHRDGPCYHLFQALQVRYKVLT